MQDALHHVGFTVSDLDRSIALYSRLLRTEPFMRRVYREEFVAEIVGYLRDPDGITVELLELP